MNNQETDKQTIHNPESVNESDDQKSQQPTLILPDNWQEMSEEELEELENSQSQTNA